MKYVDIDNIDQLPGRRLREGNSFKFRCHPDIACFNRCCRNLNLFLYPYDVLQLKKNLGISTDRFLDEYVDVVLREANYFPEVLLRMSNDKERSCPFLADAGCRVYPDRPHTCRTFPLEQGLIYDEATGKNRQVYFFRPPDFCLGQHENTDWTIETWSLDQKAAEYNRMTVEWAAIKQLFQSNPWGREGPDGSKAKMAFMATYNIDPFRDFVFNSSFLKRYKVKSTLIKKARRDDVALLKLGFAWVKQFVWGISSKIIRQK